MFLPNDPGAMFIPESRVLKAFDLRSVHLETK